MDYGNLLQRSWNIVWNNKFMFVLGFLAALGSGGSGGGNSGGSNFNFSGSADDFDVPVEMLETLEQYWVQFGAVIIGLTLLGIVLSIVFWLVRLVAQAGLISSAARIDAGEKVSFGDAFGVGTEMIGKMLGLNILMYGPFFLFGLIMFGVGAAIFAPIVMAEFSGNSAQAVEDFGSLGIFGLCAGVLACLAVPLSLFVSVIYPFAQRGVVLKEMGTVESVRHGFQVVRENAGDVILLIVLFLVLGFVFGIIMAIVLIPFAFLAMGPAFLSLIAGEGFEAIDFALMAGGAVCLGLVGAAVNSIMIAFRSTTVTLAYQEFTNKFGKTA